MAEFGRLVVAGSWRLGRRRLGGLDGDTLFNNGETGLENPTHADGDLDGDGDDLDLLFA